MVPRQLKLVTIKKIYNRDTDYTKRILKDTAVYIALPLS